jgi:hypothetical protein
MLKLILLRHGQSLWNLENKFTGWTDVDLSDQGIKEAHRAGKLFIIIFLRNHSPFNYLTISKPPINVLSYREYSPFGMGEIPCWGIPSEKMKPSPYGQN